MLPKTVICRNYFFPLQTTNAAYFQRKKTLIRVFCISGWLVLLIRKKWSSAVSSFPATFSHVVRIYLSLFIEQFKYEGWNFNSGNYLFTTDTK